MFFTVRLLHYFAFNLQSSLGGEDRWCCRAGHEGDEAKVVADATADYFSILDGA